MNSTEAISMLSITLDNLGAREFHVFCHPNQLTFLIVLFEWHDPKNKGEDLAFDVREIEEWSRIDGRIKREVKFRYENFMDDAVDFDLKRISKGEIGELGWEL